MTKTRTIRAVALLAFGALIAGSGGGCAKPMPTGLSGGSGSSRLWQDNAAQAVVLTDDLDAHQYAPNGSIPFDRFEYARRDADLNAGRPGPLRASQQWPEPARPQERRFRFRYWKYE